MPSDLFVAETAALDGISGRVRDFETRVLVGTMAGWWNGIAGFRRFYHAWRKESHHER